jgi:hypothetical protein
MHSTDATTPFDRAGFPRDSVTAQRRVASRAAPRVTRCSARKQEPS